MKNYIKLVSMRRLKTFLGIMFETIYHLLQWPRNYSTSPVDVLFYLTYDNSGDRFDLLRRELLRLGVTSVCISMSPEHSVQEGHVLLPLRWGFILKKVYIINYYLWIYRPKILCIENDTSPEYIHDFLKYKKVVLCNIAHCITGHGNAFSSIHYDYYFVFGPSSLENIAKNSSVIQNRGLQVIAAGSPFFQKRDQGGVTEVSKRASGISECEQTVIGIAGSYFHSSFPVEEQHSFDEYYSDLYKFVLSKSETLFLYKRHVVGDAPALEDKLISLGNVRIFAKSMFDLAMHTDLVIMTTSCASLECASVGTPFVVYQWQKNPMLIRASTDYLKDTRLFKRAESLTELFEIVESRLLRNVVDTMKLQEFYEMHIEREDSVDFTAAKIADIIGES